MVKCTICSSSLKPDIEKMIDRGANNQHIQAWTYSRDLKLNKRAIENHKVKHYGYVEKTLPSSADLDTVMVTLGEIENAVNLGNDELLNYLGANNLKPHHRQKLDLRWLKPAPQIELPLRNLPVGVELTIVENSNQRTKKFNTQIDSCALHGIASYKALASATGVELKYKETLSQKDLENMVDTYFDKPVDFDNYALGDLEVYNILERNSQLFKRVYKSLDLEEYFTEPRLTIGSTVRDLFKGVLYKAVGIAPDDQEKQDELSGFLSYGSSSTLKLETNTTKCLLAKVFGGRCRNNRPTDLQNDVIVADNDIAGAYGNGLRNQIYPIGKPVIEDHRISNFNQYTSLRKWLKQRKYGKDNCELVDGLWTAIVSTKEIDPDNHQWATLRYSQDFLISWFDFKFSEVADMDTDTDKIDLEIQPKTGNIKILNNQVVQGVITSDFLEWLYNVCSPQQRNELRQPLHHYRLLLPRLQSARELR